MHGAGGNPVQALGRSGCTARGLEQVLGIICTAMMYEEGKVLQDG